MVLNVKNSPFKVKVAVAGPSYEGFSWPFGIKYFPNFPKENKGDVWALNFKKKVGKKVTIQQLQFSSMTAFELELNKRQNAGDGATVGSFMNYTLAFAPKNTTTAWDITSVKPAAPKKPYKIYRLKGRDET